MKPKNRLAATSRVVDDLPKRSHTRLSEEDVSLAILLYQRGVNTGEISVITGVSKSSLYRHLRNITG